MAKPPERPWLLPIIAAAMLGAGTTGSFYARPGPAAEARGESGGAHTTAARADSDVAGNAVDDGTIDRPAWSTLSKLRPVMRLLADTLGTSIDPDEERRAGHMLYRYLCALPQRTARDDRALQATATLLEQLGDPEFARNPPGTPTHGLLELHGPLGTLAGYASKDLHHEHPIYKARQQLLDYFQNGDADEHALVKLVCRADLLAACTSDQQRSRWRAYEASGKNGAALPVVFDPRVDVQFLVATIPDYVDSNVDWIADQQIEAIQSAMMTDGWTLDRFYLPDWTPGRAGDEGRDPKRRHESEPGAIVFKRPRAARSTSAGEARTSVCVVLLVLETPVSGLHKRAFINAARFVSIWQAQRSSAKAPLRVVGPTFSGSAGPLRLALEELFAGPHAPEQVAVVSGAANADTIARDIAFSPRVTFDTTVRRTSEIVAALQTYLRDLNPTWTRGEKMAMLVESNTVYGQTAAGTEPHVELSLRDRFPHAAVFRFPMHISRVRQTSTRQGPASVASGLLTRGILPLAVQDAVVALDQLPPLTPDLTAATIQTMVSAIFETLRREQFQAIGIVATDDRDILYLARELRRASPDAQLFLMGSHLLYTHPEYAPYMRGAIVASTYPLQNGTQRWRDVAAPNGARPARRQFASQSAEGVYNAVLKLLPSDEPPADYDQGWPAVWISVIGVDAFWPLRIWSPDNTGAEAAAPRWTPPPVPLLGWLLLAGLLVAIIWHAWVIASQAWRLLFAHAERFRLERWERQHDDEVKKTTDSWIERTARKTNAFRRLERTRVFTLPRQPEALRTRCLRLIWTAFAILGAFTFFSLAGLAFFFEPARLLPLRWIAVGATLLIVIWSLWLMRGEAWGVSRAMTIARLGWAVAVVVMLLAWIVSTWGQMSPQPVIDFLFLGASFFAVPLLLTLFLTHRRHADKETKSSEKSAEERASVTPESLVFILGMVLCVGALGLSSFDTKVLAPLAGVVVMMLPLLLLLGGTRFNLSLEELAPSGSRKPQLPRRADSTDPQASAAQGPSRLGSLRKRLLTSSLTSLLGLAFVLAWGLLVWSALDAYVWQPEGVASRLRLERTLALRSEVSPLVPVLLLALVGYGFVRWHLDRLTQQGEGYSYLAFLSVPHGGVRSRHLGTFGLLFWGCARSGEQPAAPRPIRAVDKAVEPIEQFAAFADAPLGALPTQAGASVLLIVLALAYLFVSLSSRLTTIDGPPFGWFLLVATLTAWAALLFTLAQSAALWRLLRPMLDRVAGGWLSEAFGRVTAYDLNWRLKLRLSTKDELRPLVLLVDDLIKESRCLVSVPPAHVDVRETAACAAFARFRQLEPAAVDEFRSTRPNAGDFEQEGSFASYVRLLDSEAFQTIWQRLGLLAGMLEERHGDYARRKAQGLLPGSAGANDAAKTDTTKADATKVDARKADAAQPGPVTAWCDRAETAIALQLAFVIRDLLSRILSGLTLVSVGLFLLLGAHLFYMFQGRATMLAVDWLAIGLTGAVAVMILMQMERNTILSRLWNSTPGRIEFNRDFVGRMALYGALPLLTLVSTLFPEIGDTLFGWLAPLRQIAGY